MASKKSKLPVDEDGPRFVPTTIGRTGHRKVQGRVGYTTGSRKGPGGKGTKNPVAGKSTK